MYIFISKEYIVKCFKNIDSTSKQWMYSIWLDILIFEQAIHPREVTKMVTNCRQLKNFGFLTIVALKRMFDVRLK